jgi:4'-phosphopantetheinyl transferase
LTRGPYGKLALDPGFHQQDIGFNVSHSGRLALIAMARGRRLGVDIEKMGSGARIDIISRRFFSTQEDNSIRALPEELKIAAFHACWTRKEAVVKALGGSITKLYNRIIVSTAPNGPVQILQMTSDGADGEWHLRDLPVDEGYAAALCYGGAPAAVFLWQPEE